MRWVGFQGGGCKFARLKIRVGDGSIFRFRKDRARALGRRTPCLAWFPFILSWENGNEEVLMGLTWAKYET